MQAAVRWRYECTDRAWLRCRARICGGREGRWCGSRCVDVVTGGTDRNQATDADDSHRGDADQGTPQRRRTLGRVCERERLRVERPGAVDQCRVGNPGERLGQTVFELHESSFRSARRARE